MPDTVRLPSGGLLTLPDLPAHHHDGPCQCTDAAGYVRVSDVHGRAGEAFISPQIQVEAIEQWCLSNDRRLVKLFFDIDKTGQSFDERKVEEVIDGVKHGLWKTIALWQWSRWSREAGEALVMVKRVEAAGGEVRSCTQDMDPAQSNAGFMRGLHLLMAEERGNEIARGWQDAHKKRRDRGMPHSGRPRFGYDYRPVTQQDIESWPDHLQGGDLNRTRYLPNEILGPLLVNAYRDYVAGSSLRSQVREWNVNGVRTTMGKRWTPQALGKMLDTGFAAGLIRYRTNPPKKAPANTLKNYDGWDVGAQPPLIGEEVWQAYRIRREAQSELPVRSRAAVHSVSALLFCGLCGCRLVTKYQGRSLTHQWVCASRTSKHPDTHIGISNELIMSCLLDWVAIEGPADYAERVLVEAQKVNRGEKSAIDVESIKNDLKQIEKLSIPKLIRLHLHGKISEEQFDLMKAEEDDRARSLRVELQEAEARRAQSGGHIDLAIKGLAENWNLYRADPAGHRELLGSVIAGILIYPGRGKTAVQSRVRIRPAWEAAEFRDVVTALRAATS